VEVMLVFVYKLLDVAFSTAKNVFMIKGKYTLAGIVNALSQLIFVFIVKSITANNDYLILLVLCLATFMGTYIPSIVIDKYSKEKVYVFDITASNFEKGKEYADFLKESNIPVMTYVGYKNFKKVLCIKAYSRTKEESKLIEDTMPEDFKYVVVESNIIAEK